MATRAGPQPIRENSVPAAALLSIAAGLHLRCEMRGRGIRPIWVRRAILPIQEDGRHFEPPSAGMAAGSADRWKGKAAEAAWQEQLRLMIQNRLSLRVPSLVGCWVRSLGMPQDLFARRVVLNV